MLELSEEGRRIVEALVKAPVAWQSPAQLAASAGLDVEGATDLLATLDADGWLSSWDREPEAVVTLSARAASKLGVRLVELGRDEVPRWARSGEPDPPVLKASGVFRGELAAALELVVDPSRTPGEADEHAEEALSRSTIPSDPRERATLEALPVPTLLVGSGLTPWPGPDDGRKASCHACGSRRLDPSMYCLLCDRWGLDHLLQDETPPARSRSLRPPKVAADRRDLERKARKEKRKARRFAQASSAPNPDRRRPRAAP